MDHSNCVDELSINVGNFGFGSSINRSRSNTHDSSLSESQSCTGKARQNFERSFFYRHRVFFRICVFSVVAMCAAFVYMISDYQKCVATFMSINHLGKTKPVKTFSVASGTRYWDVDVKMTGMFSAKALLASSTADHFLKVAFCQHPGVMNSSDCYGERLLVVEPDGTSAEEVVFSQLLRDFPETYLNVQLVNLTKFSFEVKLCPLAFLSRAKVFVAFSILIILYFLLITEVMHKTLAAMFASTLSLGALSLMNKGPDLHRIVHWIEWETLFLLFGMMVIGKCTRSTQSTSRQGHHSVSIQRSVSTVSKFFGLYFSNFNKFKPNADKSLLSL